MLRDVLERRRLERSLESFPLWDEPAPTSSLPKQSTAVGSEVHSVVTDADQTPSMKTAEGALELRCGRIVALDRIQQADDGHQRVATPWNPQSGPCREEHPRVDGFLASGHGDTVVTWGSRTRRRGAAFGASAYCFRISTGSRSSGEAVTTGAARRFATTGTRTPPALSGPAEARLAHAGQHEWRPSQLYFRLAQRRDD